jgi:hypothetical protein
VGFLKARRQLSALHAVVERASTPEVQWLAKRERTKEENWNFMLCKFNSVLTNFEVPGSVEDDSVM